MSPLAISLRFLQTQPDERLVELARAGHERAFEALVRRYRGQLLAYCRRVAPRGTAPEDILQQGLLQAWKALNGGSEVRDARAWLYRIVHNVAISTLRASGELPEGLSAGHRAPGVDQLVEQRMAAREALAGLASLPDLQRQVMVSTALDGASHEEVAAALGLSSGSVRGLIYRARSALRAAAAALMPPPVIEWALGDAGGASAGVAGAGSAGLGALILKGSAILAVGAVAGTAAIVAGHHSRRHHAHEASPTSAAAGRQAAPAASVAALPRTSGERAAAAGAGATARGEAATSALGRGTGSRDGGSRGGSGHDGSGGGGFRQTTSGDGSRSASGSQTGSGDGSRSGSSGGGDHSATTASGSDGGGDHGTTIPGTTTTTSGSDGGSSSGSSDGGSSGGSDGGSSTTTTPTTTTTTSN